MGHGAHKMARDLDIHAEAKEKIWVEKNAYDQDAEGLEEVKCFEENICMGIFQSPFDQGTDSVIDGKPKAEQEVCPFIDARYFF